MKKAGSRPFDVIFLSFRSANAEILLYYYSCSSSNEICEGKSLLLNLGRKWNERVTARMKRAEWAVEIYIFIFRREGRPF